MNLVRMFAQTSVLASMVLTSLSIYSNPASAQQRACVITDEGATVCGKLTTQTKKPTPNSGYRKEIDNIVFLLKNCKRSEANVMCNFIITNKGSERELAIQLNGSRIVNSSGKTYFPALVNFDSRSSSDYVNVKLVTNVDYAAFLTFNEIPDQVLPFQLLQINTGLSKSVQFRNVSISN